MTTHICLYNGNLPGNLKRVMANPNSTLSPRELIRVTAEKLGIKQTALAKAIGTSETNVSLVLSGKRRLTLGFMEGAAAALGLSVNELRALDENYEDWISSPQGIETLARNRIVEARQFASPLFLGQSEVQTCLEAKILQVTPFSEKRFQGGGIELTRGFCRVFRQETRANSEDRRPSRHRSLGATATEELGPRHIMEEIDEAGLVLAPGESARLSSLETVCITDLIGAEVSARADFHLNAFDFRGYRLYAPHNDHIHILVRNLGVDTLELEKAEVFMKLNFYYLPEN